jgi:hypothetical protein
LDGASWKKAAKERRPIVRVAAADSGIAFCQQICITVDDRNTGMGQMSAQSLEGNVQHRSVAMILEVVPAGID